MSAVHWGFVGPVLSWEIVGPLVGDRYGKVHAPCPNCAAHCRTTAGARKPVFCIWREEPDHATFNCVRCGIKGHARRDSAVVAGRQGGAIMRALYPPNVEQDARRAVEANERAEKRAFAGSIWTGADPIAGSLAEDYLARRGLTPGDDLRFTPTAPTSYAGAATAPAMVACVRDAAGAIAGVQCTFLTPGGHKVRRLSFGQFAGGAIRLAPVADNGDLGVAEGAETAMSFRVLFGVPTWAAISTSGMIGFQPPPGVRRLVISADNDQSGAGLRAAQDLAKRISSACRVVISSPADLGDWNDALLKRRAAA